MTAAFRGIGGIETFNRTLLKALDEIATKQQWQVQVLSLLDHELTDGGVYLKSGRVQLRGFSGNRIRFTLEAVTAGRKASSIIIGHVNFSTLALAMGGVRKFLVVYGVEVTKPLPFLQRCGLLKIQCILSISSYTAHSMSEENRLPTEPVVFPITLDPHYDFDSLEKYTREKLGLPNGRMILTVSRMDASDSYKNIDLLITALPRVLEKIPDAFCVVVGDGNDKRRLQQLSSNLGIAPRVTFPGFVSASVLPSYYELCDLFVLPSTREGFGIVFLEAMHHGKACVGANTGGVPEVVQNGVTGILVEPECASSIENALVQLLSNDSVRSTMGELGRQRLRQHFSFAKFRDRLEGLLCE
jgi:glycosyltransferase involved in cell wall biosynthesis